jgi:hypothetical protein
MEIKIGRTSRQCCQSGEPFEHNQSIVSVLQVEDHSFERRDYDTRNWNDALGEGAIAVWATRYRDPRMEDQEPPETFSPLRRIFYESVEMEDRESLSVAYLAAQLLRRQKVFRLLRDSGAQADGIQVALFVDRHGDRIIEVRDPSLNYAELDRARIILMDRLKQLESGEPPVSEANTDEDPETLLTDLDQAAPEPGVSPNESEAVPNGADEPESIHEPTK